MESGFLYYTAAALTGLFLVQLFFMIRAMRHGTTTASILSYYLLGSLFGTGLYAVILIVLPQFWPIPG